MIAAGTVHKMPKDFRKVIESDAVVTDVSASITPLARNEKGEPFDGGPNQELPIARSGQWAGRDCYSFFFRQDRA